jgi:hypothetical protein
MKLAILVLAALTAAPSYTHAQLAEELVRDLSSCDAKFFSTVARKKDAYSAHADIGLEKSSGYFKVQDQRHPTNNRVMFKTPMTVAGLNVVGFFDEVENIPDQGLAYSWGLLVAASVSNAASAFSGLTWEQQRLRKEDEIFVRSEIWDFKRPELKWAKVKSEPGVPKPGTVERVLMIEPYDGETAFIRYGCSLQGSVTTEMLRELRPDLGQ